GLTTTVTGGAAQFTVVLTSKPTANVMLGLSSSNVNVGVPDVSSLLFTSANWNMPQTVTVTGVNDFIADGDQNYTIDFSPANSGDGNYSGIHAASVALTSLNS